MRIVDQTINKSLFPVKKKYGYQDCIYSSSVMEYAPIYTPTPSTFISVNFISFTGGT